MLTLLPSRQPHTLLRIHLFHSNCSAHSASNLTLFQCLHVRAPATFPGLVISHNCLLKTYHCPTCVCIWVHSHVLAPAQLEISRNETLLQPTSWSSFWLLLHNCTVVWLCWSTGPDTDIEVISMTHICTHRHTDTLLLWLIMTLMAGLM